MRVLQESYEDETLKACKSTSALVLLMLMLLLLG